MERTTLSDGYKAMQNAIAAQIAAEMKQLERDMAAQKRLIKHSLGNRSLIEAAERELKALHVRQDVLKGNLKKLTEPVPQAPEAPATA
jgi:hypothetical protein